MIDQDPKLIWQHNADLPPALKWPTVDQAIVSACDLPQCCIVVYGDHAHSADHVATCDM